MPTVVGHDHRGREVSTLDLDLKQRLTLLRKVIEIHKEGERRRAGKERSSYMETALDGVKASATDPETRAYLEKIISPDIPLRQETHPEFFPQRQRGGFPTTLEGMEANYLRLIEEGAKSNAR